jgi:DNA-binding response OmpR family regulator
MGMYVPVHASETTCPPHAEQNHWNAMSFRILIVDPNPATATTAEAALLEAGHRVAWVSTFEEATLQQSLDCPDLLVTAVRLGAFNGMHLLFRFRAICPDEPVIVIGAPDDLTPDMRRHATRFLSPPIDRASLVGLVSELLAGRTPHDPNSLRRWPRKRAELPATIHRNVARVVELSYGGLRLEMSAAPYDVLAPIEIELPSLGLNVMALPRWSKPREEGGSWWCGAEIALAGAEAARQWHGIVDALR